MEDASIVKKKSKGTYITSACTFCKRRHWKCDGNKDGCSNCTTRNEICVFIPVEKKRGRKRPLNEQSAMEQVHQALNNGLNIKREDPFEMSPELYESKFDIKKFDDSIFSFLNEENIQILPSSFVQPKEVKEQLKMEVLQETKQTENILLMTNRDFNHNTKIFPYDLLTKEDLDAFGHLQNVNMGNTPEPFNPKRLEATAQCVVVKFNEVPNLNHFTETFPNQFYLPPTLCVSVEGSIQDCQTVASWLFIYESSLRNIYPFVELPLVWKVRRDNIIRDPYFSHALYSTVCSKMLRGSAEEFSKGDTNELIDNIRVKIMMAFGAKFCGRHLEALDLIKTSKELIKPIEDQLSVALGWTFFLLHLFYMGEGDLLNMMWANNLSLSISKRMKLIPGSNKEAVFLEVSSSLSSLYTCFEPEERTFLYKKVERLDADTVQQSILWMTEVIYQSLKECRTGEMHQWEEGQLRKSFVMFPSSHSSYDNLITQITVLGVRSYLLSREGNKEESIQVADVVSKLVSMGLNYCAISVPSVLLMVIFTYLKSGYKSKNYFGLIKTCDRYSKIYPVIGYHINVSIIPQEDIIVANSMNWP